MVRCLWWDCGWDRVIWGIAGWLGWVIGGWWFDCGSLSRRLENVAYHTVLREMWGGCLRGLVCRVAEILRGWYHFHQLSSCHLYQSILIYLTLKSEVYRLSQRWDFLDWREGIRWFGSWWGCSFESDRGSQVDRPPAYPLHLSGRTQFDDLVIVTHHLLHFTD